MTLQKHALVIFLLMSMGGRVEGLARADAVSRTRIGVSQICLSICCDKHKIVNMKPHTESVAMRQSLISLPFSGNNAE